MKKLGLIVMVTVMWQQANNAMQLDGYQKELTVACLTKRNRSASLDCFTLAYEPASKEARYGYLQISELDLLLNVLQNYPNAYDLKDFFVAAQGIKVYTEMLRKSEYAIEQALSAQANNRLIRTSMLADWDAFDAAKESLMHQKQMADEIKAGLQHHTDMYNKLAKCVFGSAIPHWRHVLEIKNKMPNNPYLAVFVKKLQDAGLLV